MGGGAVAQAPSSASRPAPSNLAPALRWRRVRRCGPAVTIAAANAWKGRDNRRMWLILLEALGAGLIFVGIVWWTMFSGRDKGELKPTQVPDEPEQSPEKAPAASDGRITDQIRQLDR